MGDLRIPASRNPITVSRTAMTTTTAIHDVTLDIGAMPILIRTDSARFARLLADRYGEFVTFDSSHPVMELEIRLIEQGLGVRDSGLGARELGNGVLTSDFGLRTPDPALQTSDSGPRTPDPDDSDPPPAVSVRREGSRWVMERGDFHAEWDPQCQRGWVRQTVNPYSIDGVLRILHSLFLARAGGFLVHGAGAVRNGRAFIFAGISGTGKTTIARLAPPDVTLLTDEISYVRSQELEGRSQESGVRSQEPGIGSKESGVRGPESGVWDAESGVRIPNSEFKMAEPEPRVPNPESRVPNPEPLTPNPESLTPAFAAYGTPFAGELARIGVKLKAPLAGLFLLKQGPENRIEPVSQAQAVRELMRHVLFFSQDEELVGMVFRTVCDFVKRVPVRRLVFTKDASVWELIG